MLKESGSNAQLLQLQEITNGITEQTTPEEARTFYSSYEIFQTKNSSFIKDAILSISRSLKNDDNIPIFEESNLFPILPIDSMALIEETLELLTILAKHGSVLFTQETWDKLNPLLEYYPSQFLSIIAIYSRHFDDIDDPWPTCDILFLKSALFSTPENLQDYFALLLFLNRSFSDYREARAEHTWNRLCELLQGSNPSDISLCYEMMKYMASICQSTVFQWPFPITQILFHLAFNDSELQDTVIDFLAQIRPSGTRSQISELINYLFEISRTKSNATQVLIWFSESPILSEIMLSKSNWLGQMLPTISDTIELVSKIIKHKTAASIIVKKPEIFTFLTNVINSPDGNGIAVVPFFLKKVPINKSFIESLSSKNVLHSFFSVALQRGDNKSIQNMLIMLDLMTNYSYVKEMKLMIKPLLHLIDLEEAPISFAAAHVTTDLCQFPQFYNAVKTTYFDQFMKEHSEDPEWSKETRRYFRKISLLFNFF